MSSLLLDALSNQNARRPPIWMMRQAGRYLPEYRQLKERYAFQTLYRTPELAAEVTLQPLRRYPFDAGIIFSDLLVVAEALGVVLHYEKGIGPVIDTPVCDEKAIERLACEDVGGALGFVGEAIKLVKQEVEVPILGFCGAPLTVASYLIEGQSSRDLKKTKQWMVRDPRTFRKLLDKIADASIDYLKMVVDAGAEAVQVFDSWACHLSYPHFEEFCVPYFKKMVQALAPTPVVLFTKGTAGFVDLLSSCRPAAISCDWSCSLEMMKNTIPAPIAIQGNLDPHVLYGNEQQIRNHVVRMLEAMRGEQRYIVNLGHGILPDVPVEAVDTVIKTVHEWSETCQTNKVLSPS